MVEEFSSLMRNYLDGEVPLDSIRYWISCHLGNPPSDVENLMLDVAMTMWNTDDYGTEDDFRKTVAELLAEELEPTPSGDA